MKIPRLKTGKKHKLDLETTSMRNIPLSFVYWINVSTIPTMIALERGKNLL